MDTKHNFTGIIIPIVIAVILLTVLPILTNMSTDCPPCEEIPSYNIGQLNINPDFSSGNYNADKGSYDYIDSVTIIKDDNLISENIKKDVNIFGVVGTYEEVGGSSTYEYVLPVTGDYVQIEMADVIYLTIVFGWKTPTSEKIINEKPYYVSPYAKFINYRLHTPDLSREMLKPLLEEMGQEYDQLFWHDFVGNTLTIQAPLNPINYECLGIFYATPELGGNTTLSFTNEFGYNVDEATSSSIENGIIFDLTKYDIVFNEILQGTVHSFRRSTDPFYYLPKLGAQELFVTYND